MKTKEKIINEMFEVMPFIISEKARPYIYAAMSIYANQFKCTTTTELFKEVHVDLMIKSNEILAQNSNLLDSEINILPEMVKIRKAISKIELEYI